MPPYRGRSYNPNHHSPHHGHTTNNDGGPKALEGFSWNNLGSNGHQAPRGRQPSRGGHNAAHSHPHLVDHPAAAHQAAGKKKKSLVERIGDPPPPTDPILASPNTHPSLLDRIKPAPPSYANSSSPPNPANNEHFDYNRLGRKMTTPDVPHSNNGGLSTQSSPAQAVNTSAAGPSKAAKKPVPQSHHALAAVANAPTQSSPTAMNAPAGLVALPVIKPSPQPSVQPPHSSPVLNGDAADGSGKGKEPMRPPPVRGVAPMASSRLPTSQVSPRFLAPLQISPITNGEEANNGGKGTAINHGDTAKGSNMHQGASESNGAAFSATREPSLPVPGLTPPAEERNEEMQIAEQPIVQTQTHAPSVLLNNSNGHHPPSSPITGAGSGPPVDRFHEDIKRKAEALEKSRHATLQAKKELERQLAEQEKERVDELANIDRRIQKYKSALVKKEEEAKALQDELALKREEISFFQKQLEATMDVRSTFTSPLSANEATENLPVVSSVLASTSTSSTSASPPFSLSHSSFVENVSTNSSTSTPNTSITVAPTSLVASLSAGPSAQSMVTDRAQMDVAGTSHPPTSKPKQPHPPLSVTIPNALRNMPPPFYPNPIAQPIAPAFLPSPHPASSYASTKAPLFLPSATAQQPPPPLPQVKPEQLSPTLQRNARRSNTQTSVKSITKKNSLLTKDPSLSFSVKPEPFSEPELGEATMQMDISPVEAPAHGSGGPFLATIGTAQPGGAGPVAAGRPFQEPTINGPQSTMAGSSQAVVPETSNSPYANSIPPRSNVPASPTVARPGHVFPSPAVQQPVRAIPIPVQPRSHYVPPQTQVQQYERREILTAPSTPTIPQPRAHHQASPSARVNAYVPISEMSCQTCGSRAHFSMQCPSRNERGYSNGGPPRSAFPSSQSASFAKRPASPAEYENGAQKRQRNGAGFPQGPPPPQPAYAYPSSGPPSTRISREITPSDVPYTPPVTPPLPPLERSRSRTPERAFVRRSVSPPRPVQSGRGNPLPRRAAGRARGGPHYRGGAGRGRGAGRGGNAYRQYSPQRPRSRSPSPPRRNSREGQGYNDRSYQAPRNDYRDTRQEDRRPSYQGSYQQARHHSPPPARSRSRSPRRNSRSRSRSRGPMTPPLPTQPTYSARPSPSPPRDYSEQRYSPRSPQYRPPSYADDNNGGYYQQNWQRGSGGEQNYRRDSYDQGRPRSLADRIATPPIRDVPLRERMN